ncbi:hypothetical protein [Legionella sp. km772]|uniref:hypothetical protein n=1 Tax=Legionella sp. km772 TaxID=2498111 RepID=UPI000F8EBB53|nr:hypothetical protein [Legionella sp. km772]RUR13356.1 hypothetical protein ELY15_02605 [Legionella sp. km772]
MKFKLSLLTSACLLSLNAAGGTMGSAVQPAQLPWSLNGAIGYTWYDNAYHGGAGADPTAQHAIGDGQTAFGRFAIGKQLGMFNTITLGAELGVQSGNIMRLGISQATMDQLAGLPIQLNVKPMLDLLATASTQPLGQTAVFGVVKAGIAYRRMQIDERVTVNDLDQVGFELQAGLGMSLSERASLVLLYQGVFNGTTDFTVNTTTSTGHISNIPSQNGVMLNLSYTL